jgi:Phosphotransferase enzyme family
VIETPRRHADITAAWFTEAMGMSVDSVVVEQIGGGAGFMGQLFRAVLTSSEVDCPRSVIVKLPTDDPGARTIGQMMRVWEREHRCYRDLVPHMTIRVPRALVNIAEPPCLVLEDLSPAVQGDHVQGATIDQAQRAIDVLARHHATWFEHPLLPSLDWMPDLDDPSILSLAPTFAIGWPHFLDRFGSELPARCLRWCEQFVDRIPTWIAGHRDDPVTITHGDFRLDNLFFDADGSVAVIDWQMSMRAPGQADLSYFCANNLTTDMRRTHEDQLIERYVRELHSHGVPTAALSVDSVRRGYIEGLLFYAVSFGASLLTIDPANERGAALFDALVRRTFAAVDDHAVGDTLGLRST